MFTGIGAYRHISYNATLNVGGDPFDTLVFPDNKEDADQLSFEARYNLPLGDNVDLLLGGFYFKLDTSVYEKRLQRFGTTTNRRYTINRWTQNTESYAVFGNIDVRPIERLTLSAGVRYSKDKKKMRIVPLTICPGQSFESCPLNFLNAEKSWDDVSPRFVASYEFTNHIMAFASYSKGYRAGNFNARAPTAGGAVTPANPEKVSSYEVGIKSDLLDKRLRLNLGYFYQKYDDIQRLVQFAVQGESPSQQLFNAAAATIQGAELEVAAEPIKGLRIDGTVGYTNAKYDSFKNLTGLPAGVSPTDLKFDRVPKWTAYIGATYNTHIGENNTLGAHIGYSWRSHVFVDVLNTRFLEQPQYGLLDASLELGIKQFTFGVFARNLANVEYAEIKSAGIGYNAFGGSPRFYGIEFGVKF